VGQRALEVMVRAMTDRGPDAQQVWVSGEVGLGHAMNRTTPESIGEEQPASLEGRFWISADVRLDNRDELARELDPTGWRALRQLPDARLILRAYRSWGRSCIDHLAGDFAFSIWDSDRRSLFCARDHLGIRPLCFYRSERLLVVASQVGALLRLEEVPRQVNEARVGDYLVRRLEGIDKTSTFYEEIHRLQPAHILEVTGGQVHVRRYWALDPGREIHFGSSKEVPEAFLEVFTRAVKSRLRGVSPVGSMLSGGLDSSAIVGVARRLLADGDVGPLPTYSVVSQQGKACKETEAIRAMLAMEDLAPVLIEIGELDSYRRDLEKLLFSTDDLFDHHILLPQLIFIAARRAGLNIVLDGIDGDVVTTLDPDCLAPLVRGGRLKEALTEARGFSAFYRGQYGPWGSPWLMLFRSGRGALVPEWVREARRQRGLENRLQRFLSETIISPDLARRVHLSERLATYSRPRVDLGRWLPRDRVHRKLREIHAANLQSGNAAVALERYDRVGAVYSVESRHPFYDKRLVEFCLALPSEAKTPRGWSKSLLRHATAGLLPERIRWRRDIWNHLGWQLHTRLPEALNETLNGSLWSNLDELEDWVNLGSVRDAMARYRKKKSFEDAEKLWEAATLLIWRHRMGSDVLDRTSVDDLSIM